MKKFIYLFFIIHLFSCSQQVIQRTPAETAIASCGEIVEGLIFPDWRQLWDDKIAAGLEPDRALDWVHETRELSEIISFSKLEDRAPLERSYAMIHLQHPEWGPEQITYHYKIWEKSCGL